MISICSLVLSLYLSSNEHAEFISCFTDFILICLCLKDSGQSSLLEDAVISEQEIKEFQARKKDMQSQREQLRERLRHQFQMMCIHHSANCSCIDRPANGIKLK